MSEELLAVVILFSFIPALIVLFGIGSGIVWIGQQIEGRRTEPRKMVDAETKRLKAAIELEEKTIARLELEVGTAAEDDIDQALKEDPR